MKKDVIYVDIEDDITSIIEKVKSAESKIVALVPPKRVGALQSVVNLKLLQKAAQGAGRRVVLITNDHALAHLAAGVQMPVAKNLQSRPEVMPINRAETNDEEIINGVDLPVGELAGASALPADVPADPASRPVTRPKLPDAKATDKPKKGPKIPNFESFRKRLGLIAVGGVALVGFLVWAIVFAPRTTVSIAAKTTVYNVNAPLTLQPSAKADVDAAQLPAVVQQIQKTNSVEFDATGTKEIGNKAAGSIRVKNCDNSTSFVIDGGTVFRASGSGLEFISNGDATVPGFTGSASACRNTGSGAGVVDVAVSASRFGSEYNISPTSFSISGIGGDVSASSLSPMSGGTKEQVTVVSQADVDKAKEKLGSQNAEAVKAELKSKFNKDVIVVEESFKSEARDPKVTPAVGEQTKKASLAAETIYSYVAVGRTELENFLKNDITKQLKGINNQKVYESGIGSVKFANFEFRDHNSYFMNVIATGYAGPNINEDKLKPQLVGKRAGEIQQQIEAIEGVDSVTVKMSPFWVTKAPSVDKIAVEFLVENDKK